ncbi:MAG: hypothetical protein P4L51_10945 [Puia sp.]|nr:hypothetical protein [Puia sp.]
MKKGQIILGTVAFVVTAASTLAFKVANKFNGHPKVHVIGGTGNVCRTCASLRSNTASGTAQATSCWTNSGHTGSKISAAGTGHTFYLTKTSGGVCQNLTITKVTTAQ